MIKPSMLLLALVAGALQSAAAHQLLLPADWHTDAPPLNEQGWRCANADPHDWEVADGNRPGESVIRASRRADRVVEVLADGQLVGLDHGEFGGSIAWEPKQGPPAMLVLQANPVAMARRGDDVFIAEGLAHLTINTGRVLRLHRQPGGWKVTPFADLGEAPSNAYRVDDDTWLILTHSGLVRLSLATGRSERVYRNDRWRGVYPNSVRPDGEGWVIGARHAVIRLRPVVIGGYMELWLLPMFCPGSADPGCRCGS